MRRLLIGRDFGLFQETWLGTNEYRVLQKEFPHWHLYYSNLARNRGGLLTMVRKTFALKYDITQLILPAAANGRVLALSLRSKTTPNDPRSHFNLVNVYFSSGQAAMTESWIKSTHWPSSTDPSTLWQGGTSILSKTRRTALGS
jgi:exonuclease III